jgi:hypothetical protein
MNAARTISKLSPSALPLLLMACFAADAAADAAGRIDAACTEWAADSDEAFAICVVRKA